MHRDLKPQNILLCSNDPEDLEVKLADFGFSGAFDPEKGLSLSLGSPIFMAPEVLMKKQYNEKIDIWSIGVIAYCVLSGSVPINGKNK